MRKPKIDNPRYKHDILIYRTGVKVVDGTVQEEDDDPFAEDTDETEESDGTSDRQIIYQGKGRSYTDTTTTGDGKVEMNKRKISIPVRYDGWGDIWPLDGDTVEVTMGNVKEKGTVKDFEPDNNRSVVYWELLRV